MSEMSEKRSSESAGRYSPPKCGKVIRAHRIVRASPYRTEKPPDLLEEPSASGLGQGDVSGPQSAPSTQGGQPQETHITSGLATNTLAPRDAAKAARKKKKSRRTSNFVTPYNLRSKKKTVSKQPATTSSQPATTSSQPATTSSQPATTSQPTSSQPATTGHKPPPKQDAAAQQKDNSEASNVTSLIREQEDNPPKMSDEKQKPLRKLKSWLETAGQFSGSPGKYKKVSPRRLGGVSGPYTKNIPRRALGQRRRHFCFFGDEPSTSQGFKSAPITHGSSSNITLSSALRDYFAGIGDIFEGIGQEATTPRSGLPTNAPERPVPVKAGSGRKAGTNTRTSNRCNLPSKKNQAATTNPQPAATSGLQPPPSIHDEPSASVIQSAPITTLHGSSIRVDENEKNAPEMPACEKRSLGGWLESAGRYSPPKYQKVSPRSHGGLPRREGQRKKRRFFSFFEDEPSMSEAIKNATSIHGGLPPNLLNSPVGYCFGDMEDLFQGLGPEATTSRSGLPTNAPERPVPVKADSGRKAGTSTRTSSSYNLRSKKNQPATTSPQPAATSGQQPPPSILEKSCAQPKPRRGNKRVAESAPLDTDQRRRSKRIRLPVTPGVRYGFHYALHEFDEFGFKKILGVRKIVDKDSAEYKASIVEIKKRKPRPKKPPASKGKKTGARPKRRRNDDNTRMAESAPVDQDLAEPEPMEHPSQNLSGRTVGMRTASNELRRVALSDLVVVGGGSWAVEPQKKHMCDGVSFTSPLNTDTKQGRLVIAPGCTKAERRASRGTLACLVEEGTVQLALGGQVVKLKAGSQFQVPYENTYTLHNGQSTEAVIFYVLSPEAV